MLSQPLSLQLSRISTHRLTEAVDMSKSQNMWLPTWLACVVVVPFAFAIVAKGEEPEGIFFHESYNDAISEAKLTKKPIFLEFRCAP